MTMNIAKLKEYCANHNVCLQVDNATPTSIRFTITRNPLRRANELIYSEVCALPSFADDSVKERFAYDFLDRMILKFEELEREKESKMKNLAFDISRDGPVGKMLLKEDSYDLRITEVKSEGSMYDTRTFITAEVTNKQTCMPKLTEETKQYIRNDIATIMAIGKQVAQGFKDGMKVTYNPDRKDSINEGKLQIKDVIFNPPATIVIWSDDSKTVVKAENETYDPEKGLAMAIAKRALGNQGNYFDTFKKYVDMYNKKMVEPSRKPIGKVKSIEETDGGVTITVELDKPAPRRERPFKIWWEDENGMPHTDYIRTYVRAGNATRIATKRFAGTSIKWLVARENPWNNGVWEKHFGSDK